MKTILSHILYDVFLTSLTVFFFSFLIEAQWKGAVVMWVNLNILLVVCIVSGILSVLLPSEKNHTRVGIGYWLGALVISAGTGFLAYKKSEELGSWAYLFASAVALIIFFISYALASATAFNEDSQDPPTLNSVS